MGRIRRGREPLRLFPDGTGPLLHDRLQEVFAGRHNAPGTRRSYTHWVRRFVEFYEGRHPRELAEDEVNAFLTHLAVDAGVAARTQNQAMHAVLFLYQRVLEQPLDRIEGIVRAEERSTLPCVLSREEVWRVLERLDGVDQLLCMLLYGSGLRLSEAVRLRVKDLDFDRCELVVRDGKGGLDRVTMLPEMLHEPLLEHLRWRREQHEADLARGLGRAPMPDALGRKYPDADRKWGWLPTFLLPPSGLRCGPPGGHLGVWHKPTFYQVTTGGPVRSEGQILIETPELHSPMVKELASHLRPYRTLSPTMRPSRSCTPRS